MSGSFSPDPQRPLSHSVIRLFRELDDGFIIKVVSVFLFI